MKEADVDRKLKRFFWKELGLWPISSQDAVICPNCGTKIVPQRGRPDLFILNPRGRTYVCEVKVLLSGKSSFDTREISDDQRRWLNNWREDGGLGYIGLGIIRKHGSRDFLDHLYLIPWEYWLEVEAQIIPYQKSIPLSAGPGYRKELQEGRLDILHLFKDYKMHRVNKRWQLPEGVIE